MDAEKVGLPPWMVLDVRLAREGVNSGISRFIVGLSRALADEISERKKAGTLPSNFKLLFASKYDPASWIVDLVRSYPESTAFWSGGEGALTSRRDKPVYWWSTNAVKWLKRYTGGDFLWVAPGNFDRPCFVGKLFGKKNFGRVVQIVYDAIPFEQPKSVGFLFGWQFRTRVKSALARFPLVLTVSAHSAETLKRVARGKIGDVRILGAGVDPTFGSRARPVNTTEKRFLRREMLASAGFVSMENGVEEDLVSRRWVLGVGRSQFYKRWDVAEKALTLLRRNHFSDVILVRIDGDSETVKRFEERGAVRMGSAWFLKSEGVLLLPVVSDDVLALSYRASDLLVHPSEAEGFGLPPIEAALSGLPVLFRKGTAVDDHFGDDVLPKFFWRGLETSSENDWSTALTSMLDQGAESEKFFKAMSQAHSPREFILEKSGSGDAFEWRSSARAFLDALAAHHDFAAGARS
jgi:glycosyltransferase involved in cell wall biosynthesis